MKTLKVLSALLCYPQAELQAALPEMAEVIAQEKLLPESKVQALLQFMEQMAQSDLITWQENYVRLFDRGRALSLHLFEHLHGESRDRGQAMVNLLEVYRQHGFELSARELPDYLPLLLEYLAQRPSGEALDMLADALHILSLLGARLAERGSDYQVVFDALIAWVGEPTDIEAIRRQAATEGPDQTIVQMDKIWEEEAVTFMANANQEACGVTENASGVAQPVQWRSPPGLASQSTRSL